MVSIRLQCIFDKARFEQLVASQYRVNSPPFVVMDIVILIFTILLKKLFFTRGRNWSQHGIYHKNTKITHLQRWLIKVLETRYQLRYFVHLLSVCGEKTKQKEKVIITPLDTQITSIDDTLGEWKVGNKGVNDLLLMNVQVVMHQ